MLDRKIVGGTVVDGTGAPRVRQDVGIVDGRVVAVGALDDDARETIDATGLIVAPGFVDSHTHHDAQILWDPTASPSPFHGVTTVIGGNCGFTIAPLGPSAAGNNAVDYLLPMLARVEGMSIDALRAGPAWDWTSFGDYLGRIEGHAAVNAGFLVGHSALRRVVMGDGAVGDAADDRQIAEMCRLLAASIDGGGLGFSSSLAATHHDNDGNPVPSRFAAPAELLALAGVLRDKLGTFVALNPGITPFGDDDIELITDMALAAGRPLTWNALPIEAHRPDVVASARHLARHAAERGATVVAQVIPDPRLFYLSFANGFLLDSLHGWAKFFAIPQGDRMRALRDPDQRALLRPGAIDPPPVLRRFFGWETMTLASTTASEHGELVGRTLGDIAQSWGRDIYDTFFDLVLAGGIDTSFTPKPSGDDDASWQLRAEVWREPNMLIGASDAGAHLDNASSFTYTTSLLGGAVRERQLLSLEEAVHQITDAPARLCGVGLRGRIAEGFHADVVVFDEATIAPGPISLRGDLPGGARRLYADAVGIYHVLVNGTEIVRNGTWTGALPGCVVRPEK
ncbi:MAG TPA: amidohydrolase family protein [Acidimicrobiales bacterium]|nr:amidohydrolase family protein [Acidimicrobiales bacterium]